MKNQIKIVAIYQATKPYSDTIFEVIKLGTLGPYCGNVKCIETGEVWRTYEYNDMPKVGQFECETTYKRI